MSPFLISIVIPAHNRPQLLLEAINSVTAQNYSNYEVVVIDDGSTPPISHSALKDALGDRLTLHRHDSAQGVPKAKNAGINVELIAVFDKPDQDTLEVFHRTPLKAFEQIKTKNIYEFLRDEIVEI